MTVISTVLTQAAAQAQTVASTDRISIDYGMVTQHYQTTWSDPTLPAGVTRGMPPSAMTSVMDSGSDNEGESNMPADTTRDENSTGTGTDDVTREAAVLYAIDLDRGRHDNGGKHQDLASTRRLRRHRAFRHLLQPKRC
jgi:hypothetical protein